MRKMRDSQAAAWVRGPSGTGLLQPTVTRHRGGFEESNSNSSPEGRRAGALRSPQVGAT